ncbi:MAG: hypothetical protein M1565_01155 [Actinobacteria bacterium]|nr:hypothetical protein [Actinomycetota bacterium]
MLTRDSDGSADFMLRLKTRYDGDVVHKHFNIIHPVVAANNAASSKLSPQERVEKLLAERASGDDIRRAIVDWMEAEKPTMTRELADALLGPQGERSYTEYLQGVVDAMKAAR